MTTDETRVILAYLKTAYPRTDLTEAMPIVWTEHFEQFDFDEVMAAVHEHIDESNFWPSIAEIREIVFDTRRYNNTRNQLHTPEVRPPLGPNQYYAYDGTVITATFGSERKRTHDDA